MKRRMREKMHAAAELLVKLNESDTEITGQARDTVTLQVASLYTVHLTATRHDVVCRIVVDGNAGDYRGPSGEVESWANHYSYRMDEVLARLARRYWGFECFSPETPSS